MSDLPRLTLSQTKKDLMICLNLSPSIYALMGVCLAASKARFLTGSF